MDLKLEDVAQLLRVSENEIHQWLLEGKIPSYRLADEVRFSRLELENWLLHQGMPSIDSNDSTSHLSEYRDENLHGILKFDFYRATFRGEIFQENTLNSKDQIIAKATKRIGQKYPLDADYLHQLLVAREKLNPTGLGHGIAVPHARDFLINTHFDAIFIVYPNEPLAWGSLDKEPVHTLFFLFAYSDKSHLHLLAKIAGFCQQKHHLKLLQSRPSKAQLLEAILRWERQL